MLSVGTGDSAQADAGNLPEGIEAIASSLLAKDIIPCPILPGTKHIDFVAMGSSSNEPIYRNKYRRKLAHSSTSFMLALNGVGRDTCLGWFSAMPKGGNIGIVCGRGGLVVLDFDSEAGFAIFARKNPWLAANTPVERTPSGYHVYLRTHLDVFCKSLYIYGKRRGHVLGIGGFTTCSPSVLEDGRSYSWLPGQSILEIDPKPVELLKSLGVYQYRLNSLLCV